jgi:hypothetical protein
MNQLSFLSAFLLMLTSSTCLLDSVQAQTHLRGLQLASGWQRQMLTAVNAERSKAGLSPLCMNK